MIGRIYALALTTFRDAIRRRILYAILALVFGVNLFAVIVGEMSYHEEARVARDIGLGGVSLFGSLTAIILGVTLLYSEVQRRTIHTIVSKPIERHEFVLGKYLGMAMTLSLLVVSFALFMFLILYLRDVAVDAALVKALFLSFLEVMVVAAIAVFFSSFSSPLLSGVFTFGLFAMGRMTPEMRAAIGTADAAEWVKNVSNIALYVVPDLHLFSVSGGTVDGQPVSIHAEFVSWAYLGTSLGYALLYIAILLLLAMAIFSRRDFA